MKKLSIITCSMIALAGFMATNTARGQNVHYLGDVTFSKDCNTLTLSASGRIAGLGNADATVDITAMANPTTTCTSPGGNEAAGQNPAPITLTGVATVNPNTDPKNGSRSFLVSTDPPAQPTRAKTAGCPNNNWTAHIDNLDFTSATITVKQGNRTVLGPTTFNFNPPISACP